jgi:hypothetical protein
MANVRKVDPPISGMDVRDRLIIALYAELKAERETRETLEWVIRNGGLSTDVLEAIAGDPVPVVTSEDVAAVENIIALDNRRKKTGR